MANKNSNFPTAQLDLLLNDTDFTSDTVQSLRELSSWGVPQTDEELIKRIDLYFDFCKDHKLRPGVEGLALSLGVDRGTLWRWCNGNTKTKSDVWVQACQQARQLITAFIEAASQSGRLSPPIAIFSLKNVAGWKDTYCFDELTPAAEEKEVTPVSSLPHFNNIPDRMEQIEKTAVALKKIPKKFEMEGETNEI